MKKCVSILLVCALTAAIVLTTGCGDSSTTTSTASGNQTTSGSGSTGEDEFGFTLNGGDNTATESGETTSGGATGTTSNGTTGGNNTTDGNNTTGGNTTNNDGTTGNTGDIGTEVGDTADDKETQGLTIVRMATINGGLFTGNNASASTYAQMFKKKATEIRKDLKVNLKFISIGVADEQSITTAMFAGKSSFDILYYNGPQSRNWALSGLLAKQNEISTIDLNQPQFNKAKGFSDGMTFNGDVYGSVFGSCLDNIPVVFVNQTLIDTYTNNKYDVLQLYKDGQWTMEKYREIANAVKQVDAQGNPTVWGASYGMGNGLFLAAWAGGTVNRKVENGKEVYYPAMLSDAGVQCIEWLREMEHVEKSIMSGGDGGVQGFKNGTVAMTNWNLSEAANIVPGVDGEVIVVPIPKASTQNNHIFSARTNYYTIPKNVSNKELIGKVYMALSTVDMDAYYESLFVDTGLSEENLKIANAEFSLHARAEFIDGVDTTKFDSLLQPAYNNSTGSVKNIFDSARSRFQAAIDDCYGRAEDLK